MLKLQEGLHAYGVEMGQRDTWGELMLPTEEEALQHLEGLCQSIEEQGGKLLGLINQTIEVDCPPGTMGICTEDRIFLIIEK